MKLKRHKIYPGLFIAILMVFSCSEFEEPQIDNESLIVIVPRDSLRSDQSSQLFFWEEIEGAAEYELQIVSPSFERINRFVLDTTVTGDKYTYNLTPGEYQWRLRGFNSTSATAYVVRTLFVDSTLDLSNQIVILQNPPDNDTANTTDKTFEWEPFYNAESYRFQLWKTSDPGQILLDRTTTKDTLVYTVGEGSYSWQVRGQNSQSNSAYQGRTFYVDTTAPSDPVLVSPSNNQNINTVSVQISWQARNDQGSVIYDTLYLATDSLMTDLWLKQVQSTNQITIDTLSRRSYFWRVRSGDRAGNSSSFSDTRKFTLF